MHDYGMMGMGGLSVVHWLMFAAFVTLVGYPLGLILKRLGFSPFWAVVAFVPIINIVGLWVVALSSGRKPDG
jgi:hypothetical protein